MSQDGTPGIVTGRSASPASAAPRLALAASLALGAAGCATPATKPAMKPDPEAPAPASPLADVSRHDVVWDRPGGDVFGSMPLGNGDVGASVWVEPGGDLVILLAKGDAWDYPEPPERTFPNGGFAGKLLRLGRLRVRLDPNPFAAGAPFRQALRLADGTIEVQAGEGGERKTLRIWIDAGAPVLHVEAYGDRPFMARVAVDPWRPDDVVSKVGDDAIAFLHRNDKAPWAAMMDQQGLGPWRRKEGLSDPLLGRTTGGLIRAPGFRAVDDKTLLAGARRAHALAVHADTAVTESEGAFRARLVELARRNEARPTEEAFRAHVAWWRRFWERSAIVLRNPGEEARVVNEGYLLQRFMNAAAGRSRYPIKFNGSLFAMPYEGDLDDRRWGGNYWQQNTRLTYWPMLASGDVDLMEPFFALYRDTLALRREATRVHYPRGGVFYPETMTFFGTHAYGDYATKNEWIWKHYTGGLEIVLMAIERYRYTADRAFLEGTVLPLATEILMFWDKNFPREGGRLSLPGLQAMETFVPADDPTSEVAGLRAVVAALLALPARDLPAERRADWTRLAGELPPLPMANDARGPRVLPARRFERRLNAEHVETTCIFPFPIYGVGRPDLEVGRRTFEARAPYFRRAPNGGNVGWIWTPILAARLGLPDEARRLVVDRFRYKANGLDVEGKTLTEPARFPGFYGPNLDWVPDQDHPSVAVHAYQEMLLQAVDDRILLFPAWPRDLDVDFKLHAPGQTVVEGRLRGGRLASLVVTPPGRRKDVVVMWEGKAAGRGLAPKAALRLPTR